MSFHGQKEKIQSIISQKSNGIRLGRTDGCHAEHGADALDLRDRIDPDQRDIPYFKKGQSFK